MTYQQALDVLFAQLPMYQRQGAVAFKKDLTNTLWLCDYFDNPHNKFRSVHIAGTNGKGSVSHFLASVLQEAGYKVGLYTSPHLKDFRERIKINGEMIPEAKVMDLVQNHLPNFSEVKPSFFEMTVALAFKHFADEEVDIAIVETGLGGRLDSTNVLEPELSIITNIGYDHQQFLGERLPQIASEKAGIIKYRTPTIVGRSQEETDSIFILKAKELLSELYFARDEIEVISVDYAGRPSPILKVGLKAFGEQFELNSPLAGTYQVENIVTAGCAVQALIKKGWLIQRENYINGVSNVVANTGLQGRWQVLSEAPLTICDCGHNIDGVNELVQLLDKTEHHQLHIVWGMVSDKDSKAVLSMLPKDAIYYFCAPDIPRAMEVEVLVEHAKKFNLNGSRFSSVSKALNAAKNTSTEEDLVFVGGSTFVVAEVV
jgi:dihydrofolate synthase/folylpolyglutamate synthase